MADDSASSDDSADKTIRGDIDSARQELLQESRTTLDKQLGQIDKIDDAAVRTVRISLVVLGIVAGGSRLSPFSELGVLGSLGTATLIVTLVGAIFKQRENPAVYGVDETLYVSFAHQNAKRSGDGRESRHSTTQPTVYKRPNTERKLLVPK